MRINTRNLNSKINSCLRSEQTQRKIQSIAKVNSGVASITGWTISDINTKINDFMTFFAKALRVYFPGYSPHSLSGRMANPNYLFGKTEIINKKYSPLNPSRITSCLIRLSFNPSAVERKSLSPKRFRPVKNILKLYSVGYDYRKPGYNYPFNTNVRGKWRGETINASTYMESNPFMFNIVQSFNRNPRSKGMKAILSSDYSHIGTFNLSGADRYSHIHIGFRL